MTAPCFSAFLPAALVAAALSLVPAPLAAETSGTTSCCERCVRDALTEIQARGWLGVVFQHHHHGPVREVQILQVEAGGPAEQAGLQSWDVLVSIDGTRLGELTDEALDRLLQEIRPGHRLQVVARRDGEEFDVELLAQPMSPVATAKALGFRLMGEYAPEPEPRVYGTPPERPGGMPPG